jgi:hypothetical protein
VVPYVEDQKNALLLQPAGDWSDVTLTTVQYALKRGIEAVFQLEESELLAEPLPSRTTRRGVLFYEATEGGAGVLSRLVSEADALARVAQAALRLLHLELPELAVLRQTPPTDLPDAPDTACVAGCYRCLLSYYNQPDHELLDRRDEAARRILWRLACAQTALSEEAPPPSPSGSEADAHEAKGWLAIWRQALAAEASHLPPPVAAEHAGSPLHWPDHYVALALPDTPRSLQSEWEDRGYTFVRFSENTAVWTDAFRKLSKLLG